jgi:hypothetical protein
LLVLLPRIRPSIEKQKPELGVQALRGDEERAARLRASLEERPRHVNRIRDIP